MSDGNQNDDGATHGLHDMVAALHRSLKKAEGIIREESEESGYSITHFEIDFPAQMHIGRDALEATGSEDAEDRGIARRKTKKKSLDKQHAFMTLPRTRALKSGGPLDSTEGFESPGRELPQSSIPEHHLSRLKIVLRKEIKLMND